MFPEFEVYKYDLQTRIVFNFPALGPLLEVKKRRVVCQHIFQEGKSYNLYMVHICKEDFGLNQILEDEIFIMYLACSVVMVCTTTHCYFTGLNLRKMGPF